MPKGTQGSTAPHSATPAVHLILWPSQKYCPRPLHPSLMLPALGFGLVSLETALNIPMLQADTNL